MTQRPTLARVYLRETHIAKWKNLKEPAKWAEGNGYKHEFKDGRLYVYGVPIQNDGTQPLKGKDENHKGEGRQTIIYSFEGQHTLDET